MRTVLLALLVACTALGQYAVDPARGAKFWSTHADDRSLRCEVIPVPARLSFSFRFQAGYVVRLPLKQYAGAAHHWNILMRVTPEGDAQPFYLGSYARLRTVPKTNTPGEFGGVYQLGEGRYAVDWMLADDENRACRKSWKVEAKLGARERSLKVGMNPGTVSPVTFRRWSPQSDDRDERSIGRLTVLLHAAPLYPRSLRFRTQDRLLLVSSLAALLEALPARSVRVVVFNLDQQKELFRQDDLTPEAFDQVAQSTSNLQLQLVDYRVLQNRRGHVSLLADLIHQELDAAEPADKVIFLGPTSRFYDKVADISTEQHSAPPQFFYFEYKPYWGREADFPDSVAMAVKKVKGKTILIHTPDEFARAIKEVESRTTSSN